MIFSKLNPTQFLTILTCAIVPLLVTGPFLPDLLLSSISLWFLYYVFKNKLYYVFKNKFFYFFVTFWLFCIFSSLMSDSIIFSLKSSLFYIRIGIFSIFISFLIDENKKFLNYFFYTLILTFSIIIIYALIEYIFNLQSDNPSRISSFFGDELIMGSFLSRFLPLIIALYFIRANLSEKNNIIFLIFLILTYLCIFLSGERAAFFFVNMSLIFLLTFLRIDFKLFLISTIISIIAFVIFYLSVENRITGKLLIERYTSKIINSMQIKDVFNKKENLVIQKNSPETSNEITDTKKKVIIFTAGHETLYRTAFNMFLDKPIIGHGPRMFRIKCNDPKYSVKVNDVKSSCMTHPHNFYIQLLAETGIVGFSFLFSLFVYVIYLSIKYLYNRIIKKKKIYSYYNICILACLLITIWPIVPNGNFFNNYLMMFYSIPLGFFRKNSYKQNLYK